MTSTPHAVRAAAQLHEAVQDMARVVNRRNAQEDRMLMVHDDMETGIDDAESRAAMRVMIEVLTGRGFDVREPEWENPVLALDGVNSRRCEIQVGFGGQATWEYLPSNDAHIESADISRMVLRLLGAHTIDSGEPHAEPHPEVTPKGAVAHEMKARGLGVEIDVFIDDMVYAVGATIEITNPAKHERGAVNVTDDGAIWWECDFEELTGHATEIAETIADALALRQ
ncbi:MAG TPA: hypothetical protein VGI74_16095 [Streptosporangiaceae bacterium]|jgi:hypothetical protein